MADWQVHQRHPAAQQPGGGVEWYASSTGAAQYGAGSYGYEMPGGGGGGGAAYGSFEDEAPLLEGLRASWLVAGYLEVVLALVIARQGLHCRWATAAAAAAATRSACCSSCCSLAGPDSHPMAADPSQSWASTFQPS